jgi:hypothetical protein
MPQAEKMPECGGMMIDLALSSRPRRAPNIGPAPPLTTRARSRGVVTALDGNQLQRIDHVGLGNVDDGLGDVVHRQAERSGQPGDCLLCEFDVEGHGAFGECGRVEQPDGHLGISDSRLGSA